MTDLDIIYTAIYKSASLSLLKQFPNISPFTLSIIFHLLVLALLWCDGVQDAALSDTRLVLPQRSLEGYRTASHAISPRGRARSTADPRGSVIHRVIGARLTDATTHRLPPDLPRYEGFGVNLVQ